MANESPNYAAILDENEKKIANLKMKVAEKRSEIEKLEQQNADDIKRLRSLAENLRDDIESKRALLKKRREDYKRDGEYKFKEEKNTDEKLINTVICEIATVVKVKIDYDDVVVDSKKKN